MSLRNGSLLWRRMRITLAAGDTDVDTGLIQPNKSFPAGEPFLGIVAASSPLPGATPPSRVNVLPMSSLGAWTDVTHGEPYVSTTTGTVHVKFSNGGSSATIDVLFWNPATSLSPGEADTYTAENPPIPPNPDFASFVVLGHSTVTNTGNTVLTGFLGLSPAGSITNFPPGTATATHNGDGTAATALAAATATYLALEALTPTANLTGQNLGGMTLGPGVYKFNSSAGLTGVLTLDAGGDPDAQFVFQMGSTLTTAAASSVVLVNGASAANVFWQIGSSGTFGTTTNFKGTVIALASNTLTTGVTFQGRIFALTAAVTLDTNTGTNVGA